MKAIQDDFFKSEDNCWQTARANKASLLIDCDAYYAALYHALCKARYSIFILGWDIDSRIQLLRGDDAKNKRYSVKLFDLLTKKAEENPELKIYLNRWNYSLLMMKEREPLSGFKWHFQTPGNIYFCSDYNVPFSACHHQKVITIDDELAFCGGMDIALNRWDHRQHHVQQPERADPGGFYNPLGFYQYGPYHDIQIMMSGEVAQTLAILCRQRWKSRTHFEPLSLRKDYDPATRDIWPEDVIPDFENITVAVARTFPKRRTAPTIREIERVYLDEIAQAENFIYIENQYLTNRRIAQALDERLRQKQDLRVLVVSCNKPRGWMEHWSLWTGRAVLCDLVSKDIQHGRFAVTYPVCIENNHEENIKIHSKLMIVDDRFLHIGSANLNHRSMGFDTECDVILEGQSKKDRVRIAEIRNNLIREHTGREHAEIAAMIDGKVSLDKLLAFQEGSRQHLKRIDNTPYRKSGLIPSLTQKLGDPDEAHFLINLPVRQLLAVIVLMAVLISIVWTLVGDDIAALWPDQSLTDLIKQARQSSKSALWIIVIYIAGGLVFFPVTVLNLTTAVVFGPVKGIGLAFLGCLSSASIHYVIGRFLRGKLKNLLNGLLEKVHHYAERGGIMGMTLIRMVPIAPYTLINLAFGMTGIAFIPYIIATFLGLLPGITAKAIFGGAIGNLWINPEPRYIAMAIGGLALWIGLIWGTHHIVRHYQKKMKL